MSVGQINVFMTSDSPRDCERVLLERQKARNRKKKRKRKKVPALVGLLEWRLKTAVETVPVFVPRMAKTSTEKGLRAFTGMARRKRQQSIFTGMAKTSTEHFYWHVENVNR